MARKWARPTETCTHWGSHKGPPEFLRRLFFWTYRGADGGDLVAHHANRDLQRLFGISEAQGASGPFAINDCNLFAEALSLLSSCLDAGTVVAQLVVRNLDEDLVQALKKRAAAQGSSAEEAHRQILQAALRRPKRRRFADVLAAMPNVGEDADFVREQSDRRG